MPLTTIPLLDRIRAWQALVALGLTAVLVLFAVQVALGSDNVSTSISFTIGGGAYGETNQEASAETPFIFQFKTVQDPMDRVEVTFPASFQMHPDDLRVTYTRDPGGAKERTVQQTPSATGNTLIITINDEVPAGRQELQDIKITRGLSLPATGTDGEAQNFLISLNAFTGVAGGGEFTPYYGSTTARLEIFDPNLPDALDIEVNGGDPVTAGKAFAVAVTVLNAKGEPATGYGSLTNLDFAFAGEPGGPPNGGSETAKVGDGHNNQRRFSEGTVTISGFVLYDASDTDVKVTLTVADNPDTAIRGFTGESPAITVIPNEASRLAILDADDTIGGGQYPNGAALPSISIEVVDAYGNRVTTGASANATITANPEAQWLAEVSDAEEDAEAGVATFANIVPGGTPGTRNLTFESNGLDPVQTGNFAIHAGALNHLEVTTTDSTSVTAGDAVALTITAKDEYGGTLDGGFGGAAFNAGPIVFSGLDASPGEYAPTVDGSEAAFTEGIALVWEGGVATATLRAFDAVSDAQVTAQYDGSITVAPLAITVSEADAEYLVVETQPAGAVAGQYLTSGPVLRVTDAYGNPSVEGITPGDITVAWALQGEGGAMPLVSGQTSTLAGGVSNFPPIALDTPQAGAILVFDDGEGPFAPVQSDPFDVLHGALDRFVIEAAGGGDIADQEAGESFGVRVTAVDSVGNVLDGAHGATPFTDTVEFTSGGATGGAGFAESAAFAAGVLTSHFLTFTGADTSADETNVSATQPGGSASGASNWFTVNPGPVASFNIAPLGTDDRIAGVTFEVSVLPLDANGNTVSIGPNAPGATYNAEILIQGNTDATSGLGAQVLDFTSGPGGSALHQVTLAEARTGEAITVSEAGKPGVTGTSDLFNVTAGAPAALVILTDLEGKTYTPGGFSLLEIDVQVQDAAGNAIDDGSLLGKQVRLSYGAGGDWSDTGSASAEVDAAGITRISGLQISTEGAYQVGADILDLGIVRDDDFASGSFEIAVYALGGASTVTFDPDEPGTVSDLTFAFTTVEVADGIDLSFPDGFAVSESLDVDDVTITSTGGAAPAVISIDHDGPGNVAIVLDGMLPPGDIVLTITKAATTAATPNEYEFDIQLRVGSLVTEVGVASGNLSPGPAAYFEVDLGAFDPTTASLVAGEGLPFTLTAYDADGNRATNYHGERELIITDFGEAPNGAQPTMTGTGFTVVGYTAESGGILTVRVPFDQGVANGGTLTAYLAETSEVEIEGEPEASGGAEVRLQKDIPLTVVPASADASTSSLVVAETTLTAGETTSITVVVRDSFENPVGGGEPVGVTAGAATDAYTTDGTSTVEVEYNASAAGTHPVKAYLGTDATGTLIGATDIAVSPGPVDAGRSKVNASDGSVVANGVSSATIEVTLLDAHDNPVPGQVVRLSSSPSVTTDTDTATSDEAGQVVFSVSSDSAVGSVTFEAEVADADVLVTATAIIVFTEPKATHGNSSVVASGGDVIADGDRTATVTVTVRDQANEPMPSVTVTLAGGPGPANATTTAGGIATFEVSSTDAEAVTYTATSGGVTLGTVTITFVAGPPHHVTLTGPRRVNLGAESEVFTLAVVDAEGNASPVAVATTFHLASTSAGGTFEGGASVTVLEDESSATFTYQDATPGVVTVSATWASGGDNLGRADASITVDAPQPVDPTPTPTPSDGPVEPEVIRVNEVEAAVTPDEVVEVLTQTDDGAAVEVVVPANALPEGAKVSAAAVANLEGLTAQAPPPASADLVLAFVIEASDADGNDIEDGFEPISLRFTVAAGMLPPDASNRELVLAFWNGAEWVEVEATVTMNEDGSFALHAEVDHFTIFSVLHQPGRGTFSPTPGAGLTLAEWQGGGYALLDAVLERGDSVWLFVGGKPYGYVAGSPDFVNAAFRARYPLGLAAGTPVVVVR
ncbi:MAG: Ig-like domain-containing protein [Dehalococcoidia bacterium]|nr:Ig-like domain-containing protein [Dehalococcoidia bacterium]